MLCPEKIERDHLETLNVFFQNFLEKKKSSVGMNFEKLGSKDKIYSVRMNHKSRVVFKTIQFQSQPAILILRVLENHEYEKFLKSHESALSAAGVAGAGASSAPEVLKFRSVEIEKEFDLSKISVQKASRKTSKKSMKADLEWPVLSLHRGSYVELTEIQSRSVSIPLPGFIHGAAGSGKSLVGLKYLLESAQNAPDFVPQRFIYLAENADLVESMKVAFAEMTEEMANLSEGLARKLQQVEFLTLDAFFSEKLETVAKDAAGPLSPDFLRLLENADALKVAINDYFSDYFLQPIARKSDKKSDKKLNKKTVDASAKESIKESIKESMLGRVADMARSLRVRSGFLSDQDYLDFVSKHWPESLETRKQVNACFNFLSHQFNQSPKAEEETKSEDHKKSVSVNSVSVRVVRSEESTEVACVVFDEAQGHSFGLLRFLAQRFNHNILFLVGSHQMLKDELSRVIFLRDILYNPHAACSASSGLSGRSGTDFRALTLTEVYFSQGQRCAPKINRFVNRIVNLKASLVGSAHKVDRLHHEHDEHDRHHEHDDRYAADVAFYDQPQGFLIWHSLASGKSSFSDVSGLAARLDANSFVITHPKFFHEVPAGAICLTPDMAKGLEADRVILWKLFDQTILEESPSIFFDLLATAMTRAKKVLYVCQHDIHSLNFKTNLTPINLIQAFKQKAMEEPLGLDASENLTLDQSRASWNGAIIQLLQRGVPEESIQKLITAHYECLKISETESEASCLSRLKLYALGKEKVFAQAVAELWPQKRVHDSGAESEWSHMAEAVRVSKEKFQKELLENTEWQSRLTERGLAERPISSDGNCFFHAVLDQLKRLHPAYVIPESLMGSFPKDFSAWTHETLRQIGVHQLCEKSAERSREIFGESAEDWGNYALRMSEDREWAEGEIMQLLVHALGVKMLLVNSRHVADTRIEWGNESDGRPVLMLGYHEGVHFTSLIPEVTAAVSVSSISDPSSEGSGSASGSPEMPSRPVVGLAAPKKRKKKKSSVVKPAAPVESVSAVSAPVEKALVAKPALVVSAPVEKAPVAKPALVVSAPVEKAPVAKPALVVSAPVASVPVEKVPVEKASVPPAARLSEKPVESGLVSDSRMVEGVKTYSIKMLSDEKFGLFQTMLGNRDGRDELVNLLKTQLKEALATDSLTIHDWNRLVLACPSLIDMSAVFPMLQRVVLRMLLKNSKDLEDLVEGSPGFIRVMIAALTHYTVCVTTDITKNFLALAATEKGRGILSYETTFLTLNFLQNIIYRDFLKEMKAPLLPADASLRDIHNLFIDTSSVDFEENASFNFQDGGAFLSCVRLACDHSKMRDLLFELLGQQIQKKSYFFNVVMLLFSKGFDALLEATEKNTDVKDMFISLLSKKNILHIAAQACIKNISKLLKFLKENAIGALIKALPLQEGEDNKSLLHIISKSCPEEFVGLVELSKIDERVKGALLKALLVRDEGNVTPLHIVFANGLVDSSCVVKWAEEDAAVRSVFLSCLAIKAKDNWTLISLMSKFSPHDFLLFVNWAKKDSEIKRVLIESFVKQHDFTRNSMHLAVIFSDEAFEALVTWAKEDRSFRGEFIRFLGIELPAVDQRRKASFDSLNQKILMCLMRAFSTHEEKKLFVKELRDYAASFAPKYAAKQKMESLLSREDDSGGSLLKLLDESEVAARASAVSGGAFAVAHVLALSDDGTTGPGVEEEKGCD